MKTYQEMIQWHVNQVDLNIIRYHEWPSAMAIAEVYGMTTEQVYVDINQEKEHRETRRREEFRSKNRVEHEARRLANLARNERPNI